VDAIGKHRSLWACHGCAATTKHSYSSGTSSSRLLSCMYLIFLLLKAFLPSLTSSAAFPALISVAGRLGEPGSHSVLYTPSIKTVSGIAVTGPSG